MHFFFILVSKFYNHETRCTQNRTQCQEDVDDIHNAIAYRKDLAGILGVFQIDSVAILHESDCAGEPPRQVRGGVGVKVAFAGTMLSSRAWREPAHVPGSVNVE